jgi:ABC-type sugar transport system ATPase subunit
MNPAPNPAAVTIDGVTKTFGRPPAANTVLDGVTVDVKPGCVTSVLGESGCGKTTLLRIVAGLDTPSAGRILVNGQDVTAAAPSRRDIAMVFQNYGLYPAKTVRRNIEFPLRMAGIGRRERRARAAATAALMHVEHLLDRLPGQLSGGQQQRVGICRALVREPRILLMDEPLSNLDAHLRGELRGELVALQRRLGTTMLYVTHDQLEAMTMSDTVVLLKGGRIEQTGSPEEIFAAPRTTYTATFLGNMNILRVAVEGRTLLADGAPVGRLAPGTDLGPNRLVQLGMRPERLAAVPHETDARPPEHPAAAVALTGPVTGSELLGSDRILRVQVGPHTVRARVDATLPLPKRATLTVSRDNVHVFDAHSGVRVVG